MTNLSDFVFQGRIGEGQFGTVSVKAQPTLIRG